MSLEAFAKKNRLRCKRNDDDTTIIPGKNGQIFDYGDGLLGVLIMPEAAHPRIWNKARAAFEKAGMTITQDCDSEGVAIFDPESSEQCEAAIKHAGISARRVATPSQLAALAGHRGSNGPKTKIHHTEVSPGVLETILGPGIPQAPARDTFLGCPESPASASDRNEMRIKKQSSRSERRYPRRTRVRRACEPVPRSRFSFMRRPI